MIEQHCAGMYVVAYVTSKNDENHLMPISIGEGTCVCNEVYDAVKDCYNVYGVDYFEIGRIPVNYSMIIPGNDWSADIPLPMTVMRRYMSNYQKRRFDMWKANYPDKDYFIYFIQALSVY